MIITVTLNPAIDKIIKIDSFKLGGLNRVRDVVNSVGGKGINVARVIHRLGDPTMAMGFLGGDTGKEIDNFLERNCVQRDFTWTEYPTRQNIKIIESETGRETEINEPGQVSVQDLEELKKSLKVQLAQARLLVLAGSIPQGLPKNTYNQLLELADQYGVKTILDTAGDSLSLGLKDKPFVIKPNLHEAEALIGRKLNSDTDFYEAAEYFLAKGVEIVAISLGSKGAIFADKNECFQVITPKVDITSTTVGAGDSMVAGLAVKLLRGSSLAELACFATAVATSYVKTGKISTLKRKLITEMEAELKIKPIIK
ncbi:MAG: 1-phosphofructokinase [Clostridia bacterium]|jgi:1-phosphofructokinase|nr:pfkB [Clostridiales bacterium]MDK2985026.1 1-phosphofructokinase [Clostridia bacterium]